MQISVVGGYGNYLKDAKKYLAHIKVIYDNEKQIKRIPMKVEIIKGYHLSRKKITVDQSFDDNVVKIHNFNNMEVIYQWLLSKDLKDDTHISNGSNQSGKSGIEEKKEDKTDKVEKSNFLSLEPLLDKQRKSPTKC